MMVMIVAAAAFIIVMMMLMVVVMAAAAFVIMVVMVMLVLMVMAASTLVIVVVVMMLMVVMMMFMLLIVIVAAAALAVVVMMMVMMLFLFYLLKVDDSTFHGIEHFLTAQYFHRCSDNVCFRIQLAEHFYSCLYFFRIGFIGTAQNDGSCALYLVLEEFAEVSEIHFAFHNVDYGRCGIQSYACFFFYAVYRFDDIGEFTDA